MTTVLLVVSVAIAVAGVLLLVRRRPRTPPAPQHQVTSYVGIMPPGGPAAHPDGTPSPEHAGRQTTGSKGVQPGQELGGGGQGRVYELSGDPDRVIKTFFNPIPNGATEFAALLEAREAISADLRGLPISLCWPELALVSDRDLLGYVMPRIDPSFYFTTKPGLGGKRMPRQLQYAVPKRSAFSLPSALDDADSRVLLQLIARFLESMHRHEWVYGDISWGNFAFTSDPIRLCVYDFDTTRRLGRVVFTRGGPAQTVDWTDPEASNPPVSTLDSERFKFALLAYRMLVAKDRHSYIDRDRVATVTGLPRLRDLQHLWHRADGPIGTRPQLSEWVRVLA